MREIFLGISTNLHMNENVFKIISTLFIIIFIIGLGWGVTLCRKESLVKKLNGKFYYKYITLFMLILVIISAIVTGIIQFVYKDILGYAIFITLCLGIASFEWAFVHDRITLFKYYPDYENIHPFFKYFRNDRISYLKYAEMITWFSRWIHHYFRLDNKRNEIIDKLELLLRPGNNGLCLAIYHKNDFAQLCKKLYKNNNDDEIVKNIIETYDTMCLKEKEEYRPIYSLFRIIILDKNIFMYIIIAILHIAGCVLISEKPKMIIGNLLLYLPGDALLLLIYFGIVKQQKEKDFKSERK